MAGCSLAVSGQQSMELPYLLRGQWHRVFIRRRVSFPWDEVGGILPGPGWAIFS